MTQKDIFDFYTAHCEMEPAEHAIYRRLLLEGPIRGRYIGMDSPEESLETEPDRMVERHRKFATAIAAKAARKALDEARYTPADIGGIVVNTCTGYLCPGISSYVTEALGLSPAVRVMDLMGMGCGAALPNLECAAGLAARQMGKPILSIAVEICSATVFFGPDPGLIVSNCIFGDGASAAIVTEDRNGEGEGRLHLLDFESGVFPTHREHLRYRTEQGRLRNVLGSRVPVLGANAISEVVQRLLERNGLSAGQIEWWAVHAGGTSVLRQVGRKLNLSEEALRFSYDVFREYGNMSSPTVMFVLKRILDEGCPKPGDKGLLLSFGAGFTAFGALFAF
jgi:alkylresorcinol/alkylpyrone synthase